MRKLIVLTLVSGTLFCCKPQLHIAIDSDSQKIISDVIERKGLKNYVLINLSSNKALAEVLKKELHFKENGDYHEFGELRQIFSDEIIKDIFNAKTINDLVTQLQPDFYWKTKNITGLPVVENKEEPENIEKKYLLRLSYPVFTRDGKYALLKYDSAVYPYDMGSGGILVYKKSNGIWIFVNGFLNYFS